MANPTKRLRAKKNFLGGDREGMIRRGEAFDTSPAAAQTYINGGLAEEMPGKPSKADAEAATAADREIPAEEKAASRGQKKSVGPSANKSVAPSATKGK